MDTVSIMTLRVENENNNDKPLYPFRWHRNWITEQPTKAFFPRDDTTVTSMNKYKDWLGLQGIELVSDIDQEKKVNPMVILDTNTDDDKEDLDNTAVDYKIRRGRGEECREYFTLYVEVDHVNQVYKINVSLFSPANNEMW